MILHLRILRFKQHFSTILNRFHRIVETKIKCDILVVVMFSEREKGRKMRMKIRSRKSVYVLVQD